jgi:hypothetical protein
MKPFKMLVFIGLVSLLLLPGQGGASGMAGVDYGIYAELLAKHVKGARVDYAGFKRDEARLDAFLGILEQTDAAMLSRDGRMAFYINAYNAWTIKLILGKYPDLESIKDLGGFFSSPWKKKIVRLKGQVLTLDNIEHDILRPRFKDARVHFAVNCASKSCPPLMAEPYTGKDLQKQLQASAEAFINDPKSSYLKNGELWVSRIFKWFSEDFKDGDILEYIIEFAKGEFRQRLIRNKKDLDIKYLDYDWSLNDI